MTAGDRHLAGGTCHANGIDIRFRRLGKDNPPLVALHGLMGSAACLLPLARTLQHTLQVLLPDARGHGGSSAPSSGYRYDDLASDVVAFVKAMHLDMPVLLGHSMGGLTAAVVATRLGCPPLRALVLVDPTFISPDYQREVFESAVAVEHELALRKPRRDLLIQARRRSPGRSAELLEHLVDARLHTSLSAFDVLRPPNPEWRVLVKGLAVPTLLLIADKGVVSLETARELQLLNPLLQHELIEHAGHGIPYDKPGEEGAAVLAFLRQVAPFGAGEAREGAA